ncbi:MAG: DUF512 domain-containing protein [Schwartzia sp.]|nr:DUF512 domain-containing protein [Schwartzia sp. (in: firmicutes)]
MRYGEIIRVREDSLAEELGLVPGDRIVEVNGQGLRDIIDLSFAMADEEIELLVEHADGERELLAFDKDYDEELGAEFRAAVFDGIRGCGNHCWFCFVDQVAPHMRDSLYVKDDDYRLSFLYGNFVTLTNMGEADFRRIAQYHLSPLFVSVHTMNMELRAAMLGTPRGGELLGQLDRLEAAGVEYHTQVVLCPGVNDGEELERTIRLLWERRSWVRSLAIVPVGLTKFREGCHPLSPFDAAGADAVIRQVSRWQKENRQKSGENFVYLGDEFYLLAGAPLPEAAEYDGFPQLDNGVGLLRNFLEDWEKSRTTASMAEPEKPARLDVVCGTAVAPVFGELLATVRTGKRQLRLLPVENRFFGGGVNVSGLLTGQDILRALRAQETPRDGVLLPASALRSGEDVFLDDMTLTDMEQALGVPVVPVLSGAELYDVLAHWGEAHRLRRDGKLYTWQGNAAYTKLGEGAG